MMIKDGFLKDTTSLEEVMDMVMEISDSFPELNNPSLTIATTSGCVYMHRHTHTHTRTQSIYMLPTEDSLQI